MILNTVKIKIKPVVTTISELKLQCQRSMNLWYIFSGLKNCTYHDVSHFRQFSIEIDYISKIVQIRFSGSFELSVENP